MYYGNFNRLTIKEAMDIAVKENLQLNFLVLLLVMVLDGKK